MNETEVHAGLAQWKAVLRYLSDDVPPATLLGVAVLGYEDQLVEIDAITVRTPHGA